MLFIPIGFINDDVNQGLPLNMVGNRMPYVATWMKGFEIVAEEHFENVLAAQNFVLEHMTDYGDSLGADGVKVSRGGAIYFQWKPSQTA